MVFVSNKNVTRDVDGFIGVPDPTLPMHAANKAYVDAHAGSGVVGAKWLTGTGAPAAALGTTGDWYYQQGTDQVYEKTDASTWTLRGDLTGATGPAGPTGATGAQGPTGATGSTGSTGAAGTPGEKWFSGAGAPAGATGIVGDWYLNTTNGDVHEKTGASAWTLRGNLTGPQGVQGIQGTTGATGATGNTGAAGTNGTNGLTPDLRGVSVTSLAIGTGSKVFAVTAMVVAFPVGTVVRAAGVTPTNYMLGNVTAATTTSVTINVTEIGGTGTFASWTLTVGGYQGVQGIQGTTGATGAAGLGVPVGGATGTVLTKKTATDNDTQWAVPAANPTGAVVMFGGSTAPTGYLLCDGTLASRTTYATLFAVIGTTYGAGDGTTTFALPNMVGRTAIGPYPAQSWALGNTGGEITHLLTAAEMPSHTHIQNSHNHTQDSHNHTQNSHNHTQDAHNHVINDHYHYQNFASNAVGSPGSAVGGMTSAGGSGQTLSQQNTNWRSGGGDAQAATATNQATTATNIAATATNQAATAVNQATGGGTAHNVMQPYTVMNFIIKT